LSKVFVTDASERAALAVIRSLGRKNIEVTAGDSTRFNMGFLSKYCKQRILYPPPEREKTRFVETILKIIKEDRFDLLIPITDLAMVPIIERKEDFEKHTKVAAPSYFRAIKALDKIETLKIAQQHDISCPKTFFGEDIGNIHDFSKRLRYPVVIRPRMKITWVGEKAIVLKVTQNNYAYNPQDFASKWTRLVSLLKKVELREDFLFVQEFVKGEGYGVEALMHQGEPKALFMHRRLREYPTTGGASTLRESVIEDKLAQSGIELLRTMEWDGVAMVEFRVKRGTCESQLIEVNGRFWGSLPLAINSGIDFPYLLYKSIVDKEDFPRSKYRIGLKQRWLAGDVLWLYSSLINGDGITKSIKEFLRSSAVPEDILTLDDSAPVCGQLLFVLNFLADVSSGHHSLTGEVIP
jgi:predicted ATP-grasp superfamily ATP-dependent carboligase